MEDKFYIDTRTDIDNTKKREKKNRKEFSLKAMEVLVDKNSFLRHKYEKLSLNAQNKLGYHYNEILNILLFNKYVKKNKRLFKYYKLIKDSINKGFEFKKTNKKKKMKETQPSLVKEAISEKNVAIIQNLNQKIGPRDTAIKLVNTIMSRRYGISASDLPDSMTYAHGLDLIEKYINSGNYEEVMNEVSNTVTELYQENMDEMGFGDEMDEGKKSIQASKYYTHYAITKDSLKILEAWDYRGYDSEDLKRSSKDYFWNDVKDKFPDGFPPATVITKQNLIKRGIDPEVQDNWYFAWINKQNQNMNNSSQEQPMGEKYNSMEYSKQMPKTNHEQITLTQEECVKMAHAIHDKVKLEEDYFDVTLKFIPNEYVEYLLSNKKIGDFADRGEQYRYILDPDYFDNITLIFNDLKRMFCSDSNIKYKSKPVGQPEPGTYDTSIGIDEQKLKETTSMGGNGAVFGDAGFPTMRGVFNMQKGQSIFDAPVNPNITKHMNTYGGKVVKPNTKTHSYGGKPLQGVNMVHENLDFINPENLLKEFSTKSTTETVKKSMPKTPVTRQEFIEAIQLNENILSKKYSFKELRELSSMKLKSLYESIEKSLEENLEPYSDWFDNPNNNDHTDRSDKIRHDMISQSMIGNKPRQVAPTNPISDEPSQFTGDEDNFDYSTLFDDESTNIKESTTEENPMYVEYVGERSGETPFMIGGQKYQYVNAKYPNGKIDVGVYAFAGDLVYSYDWFHNSSGILKSNNRMTQDNQSKLKEYDIISSRQINMNEDKKPNALVQLDKLHKDNTKNSNTYYKKEVKDVTSSLVNGKDYKPEYSSDSLDKKDIPMYDQEPANKEYIEKVHRGVEDFKPEVEDKVWMDRFKELAGDKIFKDVSKRWDAKEKHKIGTSKPALVKTFNDKVKESDRVLKETVQSYYIDDRNRKKFIIFEVDKLIKNSTDDLHECIELKYKGLGQTLSETFLAETKNKKLLYSKNDNKIYLK